MERHNVVNLRGQFHNLGGIGKLLVAVGASFLIVAPFVVVVWLATANTADRWSAMGAAGQLAAAVAAAAAAIFAFMAMRNDETRANEDRERALKDHERAEADRARRRGSQAHGRRSRARKER